MKVLGRTTFEVSRELEYFTEKELQMQIGHGRAWWPIAIVKELVDNALDGCESGGGSPVIEVEVDDDGFLVKDNGPGIPAETISRSLDYSIRVSDKLYHVSPTRGQLGNALKLVWAAPYVALGGTSCVEVWSQGLHHFIDVSVDQIAQEPKIEHTTKETSARNGSIIMVRWPESSSLLLVAGGGSFYDQEPQAYLTRPSITVQDMIHGYAAFNPHASFRMNNETIEATDGAWAKWRTDALIPPRWHTAETLRDLIRALVNAGDQRTVRAFVSDFRGLTSTAKQKAVAGELGGLTDLVVDGDVDMQKVRLLLQRMKEASSAPKPNMLGVIGETHISRWMVRHGVREESIEYVKKQGTDGRGLPYVLEVAFGIRLDDEGRRIVCGLNWTPTLTSPVYQLQDALGPMRVESHDPVTVLVHLSCPRFDFTDRGKTRLDLRGEPAFALESAIEKVCASWRKAKRKEDRERRQAAQAWERGAKATTMNLKRAAFEVMDNAYAHASSNGRYLAVARQLMYAARPMILELTGKDKLDSAYFQRLLKDYIEANDPPWADRVVWDARGHLIEPHTHESIGAGGAEVREYMAGWCATFDVTGFPVPSMNVTTSGPHNRYGAVLFVEKEGFNHVLAQEGIPAKYDLALMSSKGMPVGAICELAARFNAEGVRIFVLHDFDSSGFGIVNTLREGVRLSPGAEVIDLGFRLEDVADLQSEEVLYDQAKDPRIKLVEYGATLEEMDFLVRFALRDSCGKIRAWRGQRVEINAMTSEQLITWLTAKLDEHEVEKVIPEEEVLGDAYKRAMYCAVIERVIGKAHKRLRKTIAQIECPEDLDERIREYLVQEELSCWDRAVYVLAAEDRDKEEI